ncbi:hypothetical protein M409DRAFT_16174 [Zasmidium cellare ATCC 36951]|uniref:Uncharacterized protein n=1 Tax=Zasmidium cellare ATCC 36951 TaxID=1080233 RepID=A0A6A6D4C3_ZASCE|nr:uncharacterized protein M409DRAFT_16174 [Zasmidium cellare ATCC 36951]KAF2173905.1 hypothetical protein M409DRAFT_16174 [Zasmidium cellare ATCC 36951]
MVTASGVYAFLQPEDFLARIGEVGERTFGGRPELARAASLQLLTMGSYFLLTASYSAIHRKALILNTFLRALAAYLFWQEQLRGIVTYEVLFVFINGAAAFF